MKKHRTREGQSISVVGLGKLGLCFAAILASKGHNVVGVDVNADVLRCVSSGKSPFFETSLDEMITKYKENLMVTDKHSWAIEKTDVTFILVATPSDAYGRFSNSQIESALISLSKELSKSSKKYHQFIVSSTLMPGSINYRLVPIIEKYSGRSLGVGFGLSFVPDFVALGSVIHDYLNPDVIIIGESDKGSGSIAEEIMTGIVENNSPVVRMSIIEAEIAKVALNCYITTKISFANSLANLCEKIPGANVDNITSAIGFDKRISPYYLRGGSSFGGTCFPRDTRAYIALAKKLGVQCDVIEAVDRVNSYQNQHVLDLVMNNLPDRFGTLAILGASFKQNTAVIQESVASYLISKLVDKNISISVYDPLAIDQVRAVYGNRVDYYDDIKLCIKNSDVVVVTNNDPGYKSLTINDFVAGSTVIDCWRIFLNLGIIERVNYMPLGISPLYGFT